MEIILSFVAIAVFGVVNGVLASKKGYTFLSWFFAMGIIGTILLFVLPDTQRIPVRISKGDKIGLGLTALFFVAWFIAMSGEIVMAVLTTLFFAVFIAAMGGS